MKLTASRYIVFLSKNIMYFVSWISFLPESERQRALKKLFSFSYSALNWVKSNIFTEGELSRFAMMTTAPSGSTTEPSGSVLSSPSMATRMRWQSWVKYNISGTPPTIKKIWLFAVWVQGSGLVGLASCHAELWNSKTCFLSGCEPSSPLTNCHPVQSNSFPVKFPVESQ